MNFQKKNSSGDTSSNSSMDINEAEPRAAGRRRWPWVLGLIAIVLVGLFLWRRSLSAQSSKNLGAGRDAAARAVPVTGAVAKIADLSVYISHCVGTVTPLKTVTVRTRVDGQLINVAYREGQLVREGDLLAMLDPRPFEVQLHQAQGQLARDQAALANARLDLKRYEVLIQDNSIPRQQLDTQAALVDQYEAALKSDQAQVDSANLNLIYCRITAPISGNVGLRLVDPGNIVHASDAGGLVVVTQQQPISAIFTIPAPDLPQVLQQLRAGKKLAVEAWDQDSTRQIASGSVLAVDNQVDLNTNTVRIKALFPNEDYALYPNQAISARLLVDTLRGTVIVPTAALQRGPSQSTYVYIVKPDQTVEIRNVDVQRTEGDETSIRSGISAGETVVIDGVDKLQPGTRVSMAGADSGAAPRKRSS